MTLSYYITFVDAFLTFAAWGYYFRPQHLKTTEYQLIFYYSVVEDVNPNAMTNVLRQAIGRNVGWPSIRTLRLL